MNRDSPWFWAIGLVVTLGGGYWLKKIQDDKTLRLKDFRTKVDNVSAEIDDIEELAVSYFLKAGADPATQEIGLKIKSKMSRVGITVTQLHRNINVGATGHDVGLLTRHKNLRKTVTGDDFDSVARPMLQASDSRFSEISLAAGKLKELLESTYDSLK